MSGSPRQSGRGIRVTVLGGGPSAEREVSLVSGAAVAAALRQRGFEVREADIGPDNLSALDHAADVVFPALHGTFGEDGTLQRILEQRGIRFVGSGARASALAMDKVASKQRVAQIGVATPAYEVWTRPDRSAYGPPRRSQEGTQARTHGGPPGSGAVLAARCSAVSTQLPALSTQLALPVVVKPADQGSSVATFIVRQADRFASAVGEVVGSFGRALVEQFIDGDEITVGILGDQALPPICVRPRRSFYDYQAKYRDEATEYLFDAGHPQRLLEQARAQSRQVFAELGGRHLARVDWMADRSGRLWFLEVNTIPGFTSHSLVPKAAARIGISFAELCERLVLMALAETG